MARSDLQVNIRMPAELKAAIESAAADSKRSMNAEIVARLEQSFTKIFFSHNFDDEQEIRIVDAVVRVLREERRKKNASKK
jgi:hypothetical protein